jgi:hypothetical protein
LKKQPAHEDRQAEAASADFVTASFYQFNLEREFLSNLGDKPKALSADEMGKIVSF